MTTIANKTYKYILRGKKIVKIFMDKYQPIKTPKDLCRQRVRNSKLLNNSKCEPKCIERLKPVILKLRKNRVHPQHTPNLALDDRYNVNPFHLAKENYIFIKELKKKRVPPEPFIMSEVKTICDIDPTFYTIVDGRPVRDKQDIKKRLSQVREILMNKANTYYMKDEIVRIDTLLGSSLRYKHAKILELYRKTLSNFQKFLLESLEEALKAQLEAEERFQVLQQALDILEEISFEYNKIRNEVTNLTIRLNILTTYRKFLFEISPIWWRAKHDTSFVDDQCFFHNLFNDSSQLSDSDIFCKSHVIQEGKAQLYFRKPEEIGALYESIQKQCLNYMQIRLMESSVLDPILKVRDVLKQELKSESTFMSFLVQRYDRDIDMMEHNEQSIKSQFFSLLSPHFRALYVSFAYTKLFICLQYINTKVLKNLDDPNDDVIYVMRLIERDYEKIMLRLEELDPSIVRKATRDMMMYDNFVMKRAHKARIALKGFRMMEDALYASFEPPRQFRRINLKQLKKEGKT